MAWTSPMTFVDGVPLTASQLNTHLRDNLLESATAKASTPGGYFVSVGPNEITERVSRAALISAQDSTSSATFDDLDATAGPSVTVTTGSIALVMISAQLAHQTSPSALTRMGYEVSGASELIAEDSRSLRNSGTGAFMATFAEYRSGLTPGVNTFTCKYRVSSGAGNFAFRRITVFPR